MKKIGLIIIILAVSHILVFILIDRNREGIKSFLVNNGIWNADLYIYLQQRLTNKNLDIKIKNESFESNLPENFSTNHFNEKHKIFDLESILLEINRDIDLGYITSLKNFDDKIKIITSNGYLFILDKNFRLIKFIELSKKIKNFYTDYAYGGIRAAKWINNKNLIIYSSTKENEIYKISLLSFEISKNFKLKEIDRINIEDLPKQDGTMSTLGGGIELYNKKIYLSTGTSAVPNEYKINELAQSDRSKLGKILEIELDDKQKFKKINVIAKGSRNSQGLLFIEETLLEIEHGPQGGDEINYINKNEFNKKLVNFGWPNFSYGLPYHNKIPYSDNKLQVDSSKELEKYYDDDDLSFRKPIFYFTPSIAISNISSCPFKSTEYEQYKNCFVISSLKDSSFYIMKYEKLNGVIDIKSVERVYVGYRIRKIITHENNLYICLDNLKIIKISYDIFR